jgi:parvulin-like peptidyl-prolyl isomerase
LEPTATATPLPEGAPTPTATPAPRDREQALALATELRGRIVEGGEDFATLAAEYSDDLGSGANGGDLGWFARGAMVAPFEEAAFALPVGEVSEPISTTFGYHLIEVTQKDAEHPKEESTLEQERASAFSDWLNEQIAAANVQRGDITAALPRDMR